LSTHTDAEKFMHEGWHFIGINLGSLTAFVQLEIRGQLERTLFRYYSGQALVI
jgi:hypothetical protein